MPKPDLLADLVRLEDVGRSSFAKGIRQPVTIERAGLRNNGIGRGAARDRSDSQDGPGCVRQAGAPGQQRLSDRDRKIDARVVHRNELLGKQGIPLGASVDRLERRFGRRAPDDRRQLFPDLGAVERRQVDPDDTGASFELAKGGGQRVIPDKVVAAERSDDQQRRVIEAHDQEAEECAR